MSNEEYCDGCDECLELDCTLHEDDGGCLICGNDICNCDELYEAWKEDKLDDY